jgi:hypothetical protein
MNPQSIRLSALAALGTSIFAASAPAQTSLYIKTGDKANDRLGWCVRSCGDVNNDGRNDFVAGAPEDGNIFGGGEGFVRVFSGLNGSTLYTISGVANDDKFGISVDGAGDVNNDGFADILVGAPGFSSGNGRVYVKSGANGTTNLFTFDSVAAFDGHGTVVAGLGDVNNDGRPDVLGASPTAAGGGSNRGTARIYSGMTGAVLTTISGVSDNQRVGVSADGVGDINGDGFGDFVIGSYFAGAKVYSGNGFGVLFTFPPTTADDRLGFAVAGAGDVNGDGIGDILVGAPQDGNIFSPGAGFVRIYSGANGSIIRTLNGATPGDRFGVAVGNARDMDGDGRAETIVGADQSPVTGLGYARLFKGIDGTVIATFDGLTTGSLQGVSVDGLGDLGNNGSFEVIVGAPNRSVPFALAGRAEVWSVTVGPGCATPFTYCTTSNNSTGNPAAIGFTGSPSIAANTFTLTATNCPANSPSLFFYGTAQDLAPFGNGNRCVGGTMWRLPIVTTTPGGTISHLLNFPSLAGPSSITPGSTWNFQFWFRDSTVGPAFFNTSNGLSATFCN